MPSLADISTASSQRKYRCASADGCGPLSAAVHLIGRPRAVRAEGRHAKAPEEVEVGCRGVGDLADVGVQRQAAAPILHEIPPPVRR